MTREEFRRKCIDAMKHAIWTTKHGYDGGEAQAISAFDSLHGIVLVCQPEATEEMHIAVNAQRAKDQSKFRPSPWGEMFKTMAAAGDLTNPPDENLQA